MVHAGIAAGAATGSTSLLKAAFSLDPAKRILLYSGVVQHYKFCSYYVIVSRVLEVFRNAASELDSRPAVNPGRTRFLAGVSWRHPGCGGARASLLLLDLQDRKKGSGSASKD